MPPSVRDPKSLECRFSNGVYYMAKEICFTAKSVCFVTKSI